MKVIIKTLEKMPKHTRGKPGAGMFLHVSTHVTMDFADFCMGFQSQARARCYGVQRSTAIREGLYVRSLTLEAGNANV